MTNTANPTAIPNAKNQSPILKSIITPDKADKTWPKESLERI